MTAGRPYRPARSPEDALGELRREAGAQFDPDVVDAWCAVYERRAQPATA
jgi:HD-GYP domain-containing protein (c-di-GMP phosphodiesterase class II)